MNNPLLALGGGGGFDSDDEDGFGTGMPLQSGMNMNALAIPVLGPNGRPLNSQANYGTDSDEEVDTDEDEEDDQEDIAEPVQFTVRHIKQHRQSVLASQPGQPLKPMVPSQPVSPTAAMLSPTPSSIPTAAAPKTANKSSSQETTALQQKVKSLESMLDKYKNKNRQNLDDIQELNDELEMMQNAMNEMKEQLVNKDNLIQSLEFQLQREQKKAKSGGDAIVNESFSDRLKLFQSKIALADTNQKPPPPIKRAPGTVNLGIFGQGQQQPQQQQQQLSPHHETTQQQQQIAASPAQSHSSLQGNNNNNSAQFKRGSAIAPPASTLDKSNSSSSLTNHASESNNNSINMRGSVLQVDSGKLRKLREENDQLQEQNEALQLQLDGQNFQIEQLKAQLMDTNTQDDTLSQQIEQHLATIGELQLEKQRLEQQQQDAQKQLQQEKKVHAQAMEQWQQEEQKYTEQIAELYQVLLDTRQGNELLEQKEEEAKQQLRVLEQKYAEAQEQIKKLQEQLSNASQQPQQAALPPPIEKKASLPPPITAANKPMPPPIVSASPSQPEQQQQSQQQQQQQETPQEDDSEVISNTAHGSLSKLGLDSSNRPTSRRHHFACFSTRTDYKQFYTEDGIPSAPLFACELRWGKVQTTYSQYPYGATVIDAMNGQQALDYLNEHHPNGPQQFINPSDLHRIILFVTVDNRYVLLMVRDDQQQQQGAAAWCKATKEAIYQNAQVLGLEAEYLQQQQQKARLQQQTFAQPSLAEQQRSQQQLQEYMRQQQLAAQQNNNNNPTSPLQNKPYDHQQQRASYLHQQQQISMAGVNPLQTPSNSKTQKVPTTPMSTLAFFGQGYQNAIEHEKSIPDHLISVLTKFTHNGKSYHQKQFCFSSEYCTIQWGDVNSSKYKYKEFVQGVLRGSTLYVEPKVIKKVPNYNPDLFLVVSTSGKTLYLLCPSEDVLTQWIDAIQYGLQQRL